MTPELRLFGSDHPVANQTALAYLADLVQERERLPMGEHLEDGRMRAPFAHESPPDTSKVVPVT
jgi:hypothetical protein